jgi:hypothetical protein
LQGILKLSECPATILNMNCNCCNNQIELDRLEVLPNTKVCSSCARLGINQPSKYKGSMIWSQKTNPELQILTTNQFDEYRKYNPYGKNTGRGSGIHRITKTTSCQ